MSAFAPVGYNPFAVGPYGGVVDTWTSSISSLLGGVRGYAAAEPSSNLIAGLGGGINSLLWRAPVMASSVGYPFMTAGSNVMAGGMLAMVGTYAMALIFGGRGQAATGSAPAPAVQPPPNFSNFFAENDAPEPPKKKRPDKAEKKDAPPAPEPAKPDTKPADAKPDTTPPPPPQSPPPPTWEATVKGGFKVPGVEIATDAASKNVRLAPAKDFDPKKGLREMAASLNKLHQNKVDTVLIGDDTVKTWHRTNIARRRQRPVMRWRPNTAGVMKALQKIAPAPRPVADAAHARAMTRAFNTIMPAVIPDARFVAAATTQPHRITVPLTAASQADQVANSIQTAIVSTNMDLKRNYKKRPKVPPTVLVEFSGPDAKKAEVGRLLEAQLRANTDYIGHLKIDTTEYGPTNGPAT